MHHNNKCTTDVHSQLAASHLSCDSCWMNFRVSSEDGARSTSGVSEFTNLASSKGLYYWTNVGNGQWGYKGAISNSLRNCQWRHLEAVMSTRWSHAHNIPQTSSHPILRKLVNNLNQIKWQKRHWKKCIWIVMFWFGSHLFKWRGRSLWPIAQLANRGRSKCFASLFRTCGHTLPYPTMFISGIWSFIISVTNAQHFFNKIKQTKTNVWQKR